MTTVNLCEIDAYVPEYKRHCIVPKCRCFCPIFFMSEYKKHSQVPKPFSIKMKKVRNSFLKKLTF